MQIEDLRFYRMKNFIYILAMMIWGAGTAAASPNLSLDRILDRHAKAMGGKDAWSQLHSWRIANHRTDGRRTTAMAQKPDQFKLIFETKDGVRIKGFDGKNGWVSRNGAPESMRPGEEIEMAEEPEFFEELMFSRENKHTLRLKGKDTLNGKSVYVIEMEKKATDVQTYYLNTKTFLIEGVAEFSEDKAWEGAYFLTRFDDYRSVEGLMFAFRWSLETKDRKPMWCTATSVELNPILLDEAFMLPNAGRISGCESLVREMHAAASNATYSEYTFVQTTIRYKKDGGIRDTMTWYESVHYPDKFRIDLDVPSKGSAVIYRNDSSYFFQGGMLAGVREEFMPFLMLEGGLKCMEVEQIMDRMEVFDYDITQFRKDQWDGREVYVMGAESADDLQSKQIWVDAERLIPLRRIDPDPNGKIMEVVYSGFEKHDGGWIETRVDFYRTDEEIKHGLFQVEFYHEINTRVELQPSIFEPKQFREWHWFQE